MRFFLNSNRRSTQDVVLLVNVFRVTYTDRSFRNAINLCKGIPRIATRFVSVRHRNTTSSISRNRLMVRISIFMGFSSVAFLKGYVTCPLFRYSFVTNARRRCNVNFRTISSDSSNFLGMNFKQIKRVNVSGRTCI